MNPLKSTGHHSSRLRFVYKHLCTTQKEGDEQMPAWWSFVCDVKCDVVW